MFGTNPCSGVDGCVFWPVLTGGRLAYQACAVAKFRPVSPTPIASQGITEIVPVQLRPWPTDIHVYRVPSEKKGRVHYHVTARAEHVNEIERYAQVALRWVIAARSMRWADHRADSRFDGKVLFSWEAKHGVPERIERMVDEIRYSFHVDGDDWLSLSLSPMPEHAPADEQPIFTLAGGLYYREDSYFEKMPISVAFLSGRLMEPHGQPMAASQEIAEAYGKRQGRKRFRGAELALRESSNKLRTNLLIDRAGVSGGVTEMLYEDFKEMSFEDFATELRLGAAEAYRRIGLIFFDEDDYANWFSYLSKLARAVCKKAPKDDPQIAALYELVDGLADEGRRLCDQESSHN